MKEDEISLSSDRFDKSCREILTRLWDNRDFADVTLATEDGRQISAHKIILTSCSQVFRNLLSTLDHPHPLIYMMGVKRKQLELVLQYVYQGRCDIPVEDMDDFLATGRALLIQGFLDGSLPENETTDSAISDVPANRKQDFQFIEESRLSEVFEETSLT